MALLFQVRDFFKLYNEAQCTVKKVLISGHTASAQLKKS